MNKKTLTDLYSKMLLIRLVEERIVELYPEEEMRCPVHLCIGQEAIAAGVCQSLSAKDLVLSNHRSHGHYLAKGGDLNKLFAEMYGRQTGCCKGRGGSMHLLDLSVNYIGSTPIVGGTIPVACGVAWAEAIHRKKTITAVFFGDAAVEEGVFHETVNFAALKQIPVMLICENNLYSVNTRICERQPKRAIADLVAGYRIKTFQADGNDAIKVYQTAQKAVKYVQKNQGPVFIEFLTYRWREHCGPNDDTESGIRDKKELNQWQKKCPIERLKRRLLRNNILDPNYINQIQNKIAKDIEEAVNFAKSSPKPDVMVTEADVYAS